MTLRNSLPRIGITMGDAAGIGPEIILKALAGEELKTRCHPLIIGDLGFLRKTARDLGLEIDLVEPAGQSDDDGSKVHVADLKNLPGKFDIGADSAATGRASAEYIETAVDLWHEGRIDAIVTAPISKMALSMAGIDFPGHTELLAHLTGTKEYAMSFFAGKLRVVLLSTHLPLRKAIDLVRKERLIELIEFTHREISRLIRKDARIAVAGLNPHASEGGMFGSEEQDEILPAIRFCRETIGLDVTGPFSPDTIFIRAYRGEFDAVISCYHDQATIAVKCLSFGSSVNVTLGLPVIRTSVDHGTAFDIAGKNAADASSMRAAMLLAAELNSEAEN